MQQSYKTAGAAQEFFELKNRHIRVVFYKRVSGWGFAEVLNPEGRLMAVIPHLGEVKLRDMEIPMRMEAADYTLDKKRGIATFAVASQDIPAMLRNTSFDEWMRYPFTGSCLTGTVSFELDETAPVLRLHYNYTSAGNYYAEHIKGPWVQVGEAAFGGEKNDALLPGVDWAVGREWSSGQDWFKDPWALRALPHPNTVSVPVMAVSHGGDSIALRWDANSRGTRWFNYREIPCQPVFASPNFIERADNHLLGLMMPDIQTQEEQHRLTPAHPMELHLGQQICFEAEIALSKGNAIQAVTEQIKRQGLPDPGQPRWPLRQALDHIAKTYDKRLYQPGRGFGIGQTENDANFKALAVLTRYVRENMDTELGHSLGVKLEEFAKLAEKPPTSAQLLQRGEEILNWQRQDGAFSFDPDGRHYGKDDFVVARSFHQPMGHAGDTALDLCATAATELLEIAQKVENQTAATHFIAGAGKALDYCMEMQRPEGGDYWETPLHAANLLAAGHAAIAFHLGWRAMGLAAYREKAVYWLRSLLAFTHLWQPADKPMLYYTKPCLCSSDWYFANWVRDHVQWEVLTVFALSAHHGIRWDKEDTEIDWMRYQTGITHAALNWISDHRDENWLPHNLPHTIQAYREGRFDGCYPDTHNAITGNYGGMFIPPGVIAENIYALIDAQEG